MRNSLIVQRRRCSRGPHPPRNPEDALPHRLRGFDADEVVNFLELVAEDLTARVTEIDSLERENRYFRQRLEEAEQREHQLQQTLLRAQKVSDEITDAAKRDAELMAREAEMSADKILRQAIEQSTRIEGSSTSCAPPVASCSSASRTPSTSSSASWRRTWRTSGAPPSSAPCRGRRAKREPAAARRRAAPVPGLRPGRPWPTPPTPPSSSAACSRTATAPICAGWPSASARHASPAGLPRPAAAPSRAAAAPSGGSVLATPAAPPPDAAGELWPL